MATAQPTAFPVLLCAAILTAGAAGVAAGDHLQRLGKAHDGSIRVADNGQSYRFIDDKRGVAPVPQPDVAAPKFAKITIEASGRTRFDGDGTPGSQVLIKPKGSLIAAAVVDRSGRWAVTLDKALKAGDHTIASFASGSETTQPGDEVRVFIPAGYSSTATVVYDRAQRLGLSNGSSGDPSVAATYAGELAEAATEKFSQIVPAGKDPAPVAGWTESTTGGVEIAQNDPSKPTPKADEPGAPDGFLSLGFAVIRDWLKTSSETYEREVAVPLTVPVPQNDVAQAQPAPAQKEATSAADAARKVREERERSEKAWREAEERNAKAAKAEADRLAAEQRARDAEEAQRAARDAERLAEEEKRRAAEMKKFNDGLKRLEEGDKAERARRAAEAAAAEDRNFAARDPSKDVKVEEQPTRRLEFTIDEGTGSDAAESSRTAVSEPREDDSDLREALRREQASDDDDRSSRNASRVGGWQRADTSDRGGRSCRGGVVHRTSRKAIYVVRPGDTLWAIANRHYKQGRRYPVIYRANQHKINDADLIFPCQRLVVPLRNRRA